MAQDYAKAFYHSKEWRKCQAAFMQSKNYTCERCGQLALIAHHKIHISPANINDPNITLNWDNLQALCLDCHNAEHGNGSACIEGVGFDENGDLIYIPPRVERQKQS